MKMSRPTKVTIATITPVRGSSTNPKLMAVVPTVSHSMSKVVCAPSAIPHDSLHAISASTQEPSMAATAIPAERRPHCMPLVMAAATNGNNGINASVSVLTLLSRYPVVQGPRF